MIKKLSIICIFVGTLTASEHDVLEQHKLVIEASYTKKQPGRKELVAAKRAAHFAQKPPVHTLEQAVNSGHRDLVEQALQKEYTQEQLHAAKALSREKNNRDITWLLLQKMATILPLEQAPKE